MRYFISGLVLTASIATLMASPVGAEPAGESDLPAVAFGEPSPCLEAKHDRFAGMGRFLVGPPIAPTDFDVDHYDIHIDVDFPGEIITGDVTITGRSQVPTLGLLLVDLQDDMAVSAITRDGTPLSFIHSTNRLTITLDQTFAVDETFDIRIQYSGHPVEGGLLSWSFDNAFGNPIASTLSEPWFARNWWPCKETPTDKATADIAFTAPADMIAASNGLLTEVIDNGATKTWRWHTDYPITTYLISTVITNFSTFQDTYDTMAGGTMPVEYYCYPDHLNIAQAAWAVTVPQINYFRTIYGEYPFVDEKYGMAEFPWGGAMEHQTLTSMGEGSIESERTIAHELAHQWWGDLVTCATWHDIWLNEGFATWSEAMWYGSVHGEEGYRQYMGWLNDEDGFPSPIYRYDLSDPWGIFSYVVYYKGAWAVHMLRGVLGEQDFWDGLTAYRAAFAFDAATTDQLKAIFETQSGQDLDWFFDQWIYGDSRPDYRYSWRADEPTPGQMTLYIDQVQTNVPPFTMPIEIDVVTDTGTERFTVWNSQASESYVLDPTGVPQSIVFDPDDWILDWHQEVMVDTPADPTLVTGPRLTGVRPLPFRTHLHVDYQGADDATLIIFDASGRLVRELVSAGNAVRTGSVVWDGRTDAGRVTPPGIYFLRLEAPGTTEVRRVVRVY
jgi:aminopeptidase N